MIASRREAPAIGHAGIAFRHLRKSRRGLISLTVLGLLLLVAIFADVLASPGPLLSVGGGRPVEILPGALHPERYSGLTKAQKAASHGDAFVVWPLVTHGPKAPSGAGLEPNSADHLLGTDSSGRDVFARLVHGARTAVILSFGAVLLGMLLGVFLGALAGQRRGFFDNRLVRLVETVDTFPAIVLVAVVRAIEETPRLETLVIVVALFRWAEVARLVRAEVLRVSTEDWVLSARALGASSSRLLLRHMLPNAVGPAIVSSVFGLGSVILLETSVSFLEIGGVMEQATWGAILADGARHPERLSLILAPGLLLALSVGATYLLADAARDALDPRTVRGAP